MPKKSKSIKKTDNGKAWAKRKMTAKSYKMDSRETAKSFLIVCEGCNTEPQYFKAFPLGNAEIECFGLGMSKTALVQQVLEMRRLDESYTEKEIWIVFDFDRADDQLEQQKADYNQAITLAQQNNIKVAYSNDAFELWFLLHYEHIEIQWTRKEYYQKLSEIWDCNYEKCGKQYDFCSTIFQRLANDPNACQQKAIERAKELLSHQSGIPFADQVPCTSVHLLVQELNFYLKSNA